MTPANKRAIRTGLQTFAAVVAVVPALAAVVADSEALAAAAPWAVAAAATAAGAAGLAARVMASPVVEQILDRFGLGLVDDDGDPAQ